MLVCYAISLIYVAASGALSFLFGEIAIGTVRPFEASGGRRSAFAPAFPLVSLTILILALSACWYLVRDFGRGPLEERTIAKRLGAVALIAGLSCGVVDYFGAQTMVAAALFSVPSIAAISTLKPRRATSYGSAGGIVFGLMAAIGSGLSDETNLAFLISLTEGFIIGGIVGAFAGWISSVIAERVSGLRPSQLAGAGGGIGVGAVASLVGIIVASKFSAISDGMLGLFAVSWVALPFANAALDYLSLGVSHAIGRHLYYQSPRAHSILCLLVLDLFLALAFMVLTVVTAGLSLLAVAEWLGVETSSYQFLLESAADPWGEGLWLTIMALTTVLWTWLHFAFVVAPLASVVFVNRTIERAAERRLAVPSHGDSIDGFNGALILLRFVTFYGLWTMIALAPALIILQFPEIMGMVLELAAAIFGAII
ncbi:MAG: hypothetical protein AAGG69_07300 [Pseudomonadota bacterium]